MEKQKSILFKLKLGFLIVSLFLLFVGVGLVVTFTTSSQMLKSNIDDDLSGFKTTSVWDGTSTSFTQGSGLPNDPYIIDSAAKLKYLGDYYSTYNACYFKQTVNIDLAGRIWTPINSVANYYHYFYDGNGCTISNLYIYSGSQHVGLFGLLYGGGYIKNLGIESGSVTGNYSSYSYTGGLSGKAENGVTIENCYNKANVQQTGGSGSSTAYVGGLVGYAYCSTLTNCYNTGSVSAEILTNIYIGGVAGYSYASSWLNVYNTGSVSGICTYTSTTRYVHSGGIAGYADSLTITNGYNTGSVLARNSGSGSTSNSIYAGGICGYSSGVMLICSFNTGQVTAMRGDTSYTSDSNIYGGGLSGYVSSLTVSNSYFDKDTSGTTYGWNGDHTNYGLTTSEMQSGAGVAPSGMSAYLAAEWNFVSGEYPTLKFFTPESNPTGSNTTSVWDGTSTEFTQGTGAPSDPYIIDSAAKLAYLSNYNSSSTYKACYFKQTVNIDLKSLIWTPIGSGVSHFFYDGNGCTISNLSFSSGSQYIGLFGMLYYGGYIKNLGIESGSITSTYSSGGAVGGLVGYAYGGITIENCYNKASIQKTGGSGMSTAYVGGLVGYTNSLTLINCYSTGSVSAETENSIYIGGVAGYGGYGSWTNVYNSGSVTGECTYTNITRSVYSGGIVGYSPYLTITNAYNTGSVLAQNSGSTSTSNPVYAGGIYGSGNSYNILICSFNTGLITAKRGDTSSTSGTSIYAGGLSGYNLSKARNSYFDKNTSGTTYGWSGSNTTYGLTTGVMQSASNGTSPSGMTGFTTADWVFKASNYPTLKVFGLYKPTNSSVEYTGSTILITDYIKGFDASKINVAGNSTGTNVGNYSATFSLKDSSDVWNDSTTGSVTITWTIVKATNNWITTPSIAGWTFGGTPSTPVAVSKFGTASFSYKNSSNQPITPSATTPAGTYTMTATVADTSNYTGLSFYCEFEITIASVAKPSITGASFSYNTGTQGPTISGFNSTFMTVSGTQSAQNVGSYCIAIMPNVSTTWSDGTVDAVYFAWEITKASLPTPTLLNDHIAFDATTKTVLVDNLQNFDSTKMETSGRVSQDHAGTYYFVVYLKPAYRDNYVFANGRDFVVIEWSIDRQD